MLVTQSCLTLWNPWTVTQQVPMLMEFSRQEYWSEFPFSSPGDLPDPRIEPRSLHCRQILYCLRQYIYMCVCVCVCVYSMPISVCMYAY